MQSQEVLIELVQQQAKKIRELETKVMDLSDHVLRLAICKETKPAYPYYNLIVESGITMEQKSTIDLLFLVLSDKVNGFTLTDKHKQHLTNFQLESICDAESIPYPMIEEALMKILDVKSQEVPFELITVMRDQGLYQALCDYLLSQATHQDE